MLIFICMSTLNTFGRSALAGAASAGVWMLVVCPCQNANNYLFVYSIHFWQVSFGRGSKHFCHKAGVCQLLYTFLKPVCFSFYDLVDWEHPELSPRNLHLYHSDPTIQLNTVPSTSSFRALQHFHVTRRYTDFQLQQKLPHLSYAREEAVSGP